MQLASPGYSLPLVKSVTGGLPEIDVPICTGNSYLVALVHDALSTAQGRLSS